ncbi:hypothetical protein [Flavobacterium sp.]|uniref:hypothetical protein n=1 Tax=Flavobacterium sp. TaxID=239 RepID=UPI0025BCA2CF|nr:hypothetical protein [Flavobacterium sp.]
MAQSQAGRAQTHLEQNHRQKFVNPQGYIGVDDSFDSEEEHSFGDDLSDVSKATLPDLALASHFYYLLATPELLKNSHDNPDVVAPQPGNSTPKYIVQRVIRI